MRSSRRRRPALLALAVLVAVPFAGACSAVGGVDPAAATVDGDAIDRDEFEAELGYLIANEAFATSLELEPGSPRLPAQISAVWLQLRIRQTVVDAEFERRGLEVSEADTAAAQAQVEQTLFPPDQLSLLPEGFVATLVDRTARETALTTALGQSATPSAEEQEAFFAAQCPTGLQVSHILVSSREEAVAVRTELADGADFDELADARSGDPGTLPGGLLGCLVEGGGDPTFVAAAFAAEPGTPTEPVETQFGFHVILVEPGDYREFSEQIVAALREQGDPAAGNPIDSFLVETLASAEVEVDPRYGRWVVDPDDPQGPRLEPPTVPDVRDGREPAAEVLPEELAPIPPAG